MNDRISRLIDFTGSFRFWKWKTLKDGTAGHICINRFRLVQEDGRYGVPTKVTFLQGNNPYSTNGHPFNINGWGSPDNEIAEHWCSWDLPVIVMEFSEPTSFTSYKFETHETPCTNDPQEWNIEVSIDGTNWTVANHQKRDCVTNPIARNGYNEFPLGRNECSINNFICM